MQKLKTTKCFPIHCFAFLGSSVGLLAFQELRLKDFYVCHCRQSLNTRSVLLSYFAKKTVKQGFLWCNVFSTGEFTVSFVDTEKFLSRQPPLLITSQYERPSYMLIQWKPLRRTSVNRNSSVHYAQTTGSRFFYYPY